MVSNDARCGRELLAEQEALSASCLQQSSYVYSIMSQQRLIRRVFLDLIGLPPSIAQVDAFVKDTRPGRI